MVFNYVFCDEIYHIGTKGHWMNYDELCYQPSLLFNSRQLYRETALLPYKLADFRLGRDYYGPAYLCDIGEFLQRRSKAQIRVMARVTCHDHDHMDLYGDYMTATRAYWTKDLWLV